MKLSISTKAPGHINKEQAKADTERYTDGIRELQKKFYAQAKYSMLIIIQGLDASGKDGLISDVFKGVNPLGCTVKAFKAPTKEELAHDFLWRIHKHTPEKGMIQIFNRSHYEDVLITRVEKWIDDETARKRFQDINNFEQLLMNNNTVILKFYLHISPEEQHKRLMERKTNPEKFWKHNDGDWETRKKFDDYMKMYEDVFAHCNHPEWTIVPSDQNWYKEYIVAKKIYESLESLKPEYPR
ncbi:MAG: polyphosphate kinase [Cytophagaceae bacterium]|nr:polyphosphate kinase [Cytophagaceae bacterium]MDW8456844.1 polyphosphate kinase [Cytophagaceae bacterium]